MKNVVISLEEIEKLTTKADRASIVLKSLSNKWRLLLLCQLVKGEKSVGELEKTMELSQSALSQHLAVLRKNRLVTTRRDAQMVYYSIGGIEAPVILHALYELYCQPPKVGSDEIAA